ncbi:ATP-binding protein [Umezawaea sp.]|uniref:ATP-binding protein n=1 Tax=Umezawaea sp. TaxID=1955258 RepID=UPI002ED14F26
MEHSEPGRAPKPSGGPPLVSGPLPQAVSRLISEVQDVLALVLLPWERDLSTHPSPWSVRTGVRRHLAAAVHPDVLTDVLLVVEELVENAYQHTGSARRLRVDREGCAVRVEVTDGDPAEPVLHLAHPVGPHHHGVLLVHELCHEWGVRPATDGGPGKTVWGVLREHPEC